MSRLPILDYVAVVAVQVTEVWLVFTLSEDSLAELHLSVTATAILYKYEHTPYEQERRKI